MLEYLNKLAPRNPWHFMWIATLFSIVLTSIITVSFSYFFFGEIDHRTFLISFLDGLIVPIIVAPVVIYLIVVERKRVEKELHELSLTDDLTNLRNRRGFYVLAEQELKLADRSKKGIFILYADIDNFKHINDTYGHSEGDRLLIDIANILRKNCRFSDVIARIGGDEFVIIPVATSEDNIDMITTRFINAVELYNKQAGKTYDLSLSIGVILYDPESPSSLDELLRKVDEAMYRDKIRDNKARPDNTNYPPAK